MIIINLKNRKDYKLNLNQFQLNLQKNKINEAEHTLYKLNKFMLSFLMQFKQIRLEEKKEYFEMKRQRNKTYLKGQRGKGLIYLIFKTRKIFKNS